MHPILHRVRAWLLFWLALLCFARTAECVELVENGSFEAPDGLSPRIGWDDARGIGNDRGFGDFQHPFVFLGEVAVGVAAELPPGATDPNFTGVVRPNGAGSQYGLSWGSGKGVGRASDHR
jgi:hypothetical protein